MGDFEGMGSVPANTTGSDLSDAATNPNSRDAIEKTTDMGIQQMGHAGKVDTPPDGERGNQYQDPVHQQFDAQDGEDFDKKDIIRHKKLPGGPIFPSGTGQTFVP